MGRLFEMRQSIDKLLAGKPDQFVVKGKIGMAAGMLIGGISDKTPDDPAAIAKLAAAVKQVLGVQI